MLRSPGWPVCCSVIWTLLWTTVVTMVLSLFLSGTHCMRTSPVISWALRKEQGAQRTRRSSEQKHASSYWKDLVEVVWASVQNASQMLICGTATDKRLWASVSNWWRISADIHLHLQPCSSMYLHVRFLLLPSFQSLYWTSLSSVLELRGRKASRLNTWEAIQKENLLSAQNKRQRESDTARLKCTSVK